MKHEVKYKLYGAILGDLCGQPYEFPPMKGPYTDVNIHNPDSTITDDTIMTLATAFALLYNLKFEMAYKYFGLIYDGDYYGRAFKEWLKTPNGTAGYSYGNGCLMRLSPIMYLESLEDIEHKVLESCVCSHLDYSSIHSVISLTSDYTFALSTKESAGRFPIDDIKPFEDFMNRADDTYKFVKNLYFSSWSTKQAILKAVECGGDTDTNASIIGELCNFTYNDITEEDVVYVESKLDPFLLNILKEFNEKYK